ncbi:MAG: nucleotidyltransferase family protein [Candidatus Zixiibacteriota bacterium]
MYLFGSLPEGRFDLDSDIDVACKGIPNEAFLRASALLDSLSPEFNLELVELDHISPLLRRRILEKGELIYERT